MQRKMSNIWQSWKNSRAFIGKKNQAPNYAVDNEFIIRGYRINHNSCKRICSSLFSCHNESVNVWSHLCGVGIFLTMFLLLMITYATNESISQQMQQKFYIQRANDKEQDIIVFLDQQMITLDYTLNSITDIVTDQSEFNATNNLINYSLETDVKEFVKKAEGVTFLIMTELFSSQYILRETNNNTSDTDESLITSSLTEGQLIDKWNSNLIDYSIKTENIIAQMLTQLQTFQMNSDLPKSGYQNRAEFLKKRLLSYIQEISQLTDYMKNKLANNELSDIANYYDSDVKQQAPEFKPADDILSYTPLYPLFCHLASACLCLGCSAFYHLFYVQSEDHQTTLSRLDYGGISLLILGSTIPMVVYPQACDPVIYLRRIMASISILCGTICFLMTMIPKFDQQQYRPFRGIMFIIYGLSGSMPLVASAWSNEYMIKIRWYIYTASGAIYILGALIYIFRLPERWSPGRFDLCGASHQIFHIMVVTACLMMYTEAFRGYENRTLFECPIWITQ